MLKKLLTSSWVQPNCVQCTVKAGDMVIFDNAIWHTGLTLTLTIPRWHVDFQSFQLWL
jgi:ectoine hydroxylase-related dioxygenase (phytanoyl-CoA dioxygenase family)